MKISNQISKSKQKEEAFRKTLEAVPEEKRKRIAEKIRSLRKEHGYSQEHIAEYLGVALKTYQWWESGKIDKKYGFYYPSIDYVHLFALSDLYKVSVDFLLGRSEYTAVENELIGRETGLSDASIITLQKKHTQEKEVKLMLNFLLGKQPERGCNLLFLMYHYLFGNYNKIRGLNGWGIDFMDDIDFNGVSIEITEINSVFKSMVESQIQKIKAFVDSSEELHDYGKFIPSEDECKNTIINCNNEIERAKREMRKGINKEFWEKHIEAQRAVITRYENVLNIKYGQ